MSINPTLAPFLLPLCAPFCYEGPPRRAIALYKDCWYNVHHLSQTLPNTHPCFEIAPAIL